MHHRRKRKLRRGRGFCPPQIRIEIDPIKHNNDQEGDTMTEQELMRLIMAVRSLLKAIDRSLMSETYQGIADTMADNYRALHTKILEHYPDDYYVTTVLKLNIPEDAEDRQKVALVQLAASQMQSYLMSIQEGDEDDFPFRGRGPRFRGRPHGGPPHDIGRDISEDVMEFTRKTIRKALSSIDVDIDIPEPPEPPKPPRPPEEKPKRRESGDGDDSYI